MTSTASTSNSVAPSEFIQSLQKTGDKGTTSLTQLMTDEESRFLKLLTTQLQNQDPMNPLDNAQMTSQMAQISAVKGIEKINLTLQKLIDNTSDAQWLQAAGIVGHQVLAPGSGLDLAYLNDGARAQGGIELDAPADRVTVKIKDARGLPVRTLELGAASKGVKSFQWDGLNDAGEAMAAGRYSFSLSAVRGDEEVKGRALQAAQVSGVLRENGNLVLDTLGLGRMAMADIKLIV